MLWMVKRFKPESCIHLLDRELDDVNTPIPNFLQNTIFALLLFALKILKKIRNRAGYYSSFSKSSAQKSSRPKHSILKELGYIGQFKFD